MNRNRTYRGFSHVSAAVPVCRVASLCAIIFAVPAAARAQTETRLNFDGPVPGCLYLELQCSTQPGGHTLETAGIRFDNVYKLSAGQGYFVGASSLPYSLNPYSHTDAPPFGSNVITVTSLDSGWTDVSFRIFLRASDTVTVTVNYGSSGIVSSRLQPYVDSGATISLTQFVSGQSALAIQSFKIGVSSADADYSVDDFVFENSPNTSHLVAVNPFAPYAALGQAPAVLSMPASIGAVLRSPPAKILAADGASAAVLVYRSQSKNPVTFSLSTTDPEPPAGSPVGSLGPFDEDFLVTANVPASNSKTYTAWVPAFGPDVGGNYVFLALLGAPKTMSAAIFPEIRLVVTAAQPGQSENPQAFLSLEPPPLLLIHGVWSDTSAAKFAPGKQGLSDYVLKNYRHQLILPVNYGVVLPDGSNLSAHSFSDPAIQAILKNRMLDALGRAALAGMVARKVDVVGHSMGGLVTRYFLSQSPTGPATALAADPVHQLITVGTPHLGTNLATVLDTFKFFPPTTALVAFPELVPYCPPLACSLQSLMAAMGKQVGPATESLEPNSPPLLAMSPNATFRAIIGDSTGSNSASESLLNVLIKLFLPLKSVATILNHEDNDSIVPVSSQHSLLLGVTDWLQISGIVHTSLCDFCGDIGETASASVWAKTYSWLMGALPVSGSHSNEAPQPRTSSSASPAPLLDFTGYTEVNASTVTFQPATGSALPVNVPTGISAAAPGKTITEVLLSQTVTEPGDTPLLFAAQAPFTVSFAPGRLGSTTFRATVVFNDNTYAVATLNYTIQYTDPPYSINLVDPPGASMSVGDSRDIEADALFASGAVNVTKAATYATRSGKSLVFTVDSGGTISANGNGVDLLDVSYGGVTATAEIAVGACTYALNPTNQIVPNTGGAVTIHVATQSGCSWTAGGGAEWLSFTQASGTGSGDITLMAAPNASGHTISNRVTLAGLQAAVTQPATACTNSLSRSRIDAPAAGASGAITVTGSCPIVVYADNSWLTAVSVGTSVQYTVAPNDGTVQRTAALTIGTLTVPVTQAPAAHLVVVVGHTGNFWQGQIAAAYTITVSNAASAGSSSGTVTVTETLPAGLALASMSASGWTCASNVCTRSDVLAPGSSFPAITVKVNVALSPPSLVTNSVSVSGGSSLDGAASDLTALVPFSCDLDADQVANVIDVQLLIREAVGLVPATHDLDHDGVVNSLDVQKLIRASLGFGCVY